MKNRLVKSVSVMLILLSTVSLLFTGCGNDSTEQKSASTTNPATTVEQAPAKEVTLKVIDQRVEDKAFYDEFIPQFQEKYPNIKVQYDALPTKDYPTLCGSRLMSNDVDVFVPVGIATKTTEEGRAYLQDLAGQKFLENFYPSALVSGQYKGQQLELPMNSVASIVFYNKKMFADMGVSVPGTWDEFVAACETIKGKGIDPIMFGGKDQWPVNMMVISLEAPIVQAADKDFYKKMRTEETKFTDAPWVDVLTKLSVLGKYLVKNSLGIGYGQAPGLFAQGKAAMMIDGSWSLSQIEDAKPEFEVGAFLLPGSNNKEANTLAPTKKGVVYSVHKKSSDDNKNAAYIYLSYLLETENYQRYTDVTKMFPLCKGIKMGSSTAQEISDMLTNQTEMWEEYWISGGKYDETGIGLQVVAGKITPPEAAKKMQADLIGSKADWKPDWRE